MRLAALVLAATVGWAQSSDDVLVRARRKILASLDRLPNYTCVQTLTREYSMRSVRWPTCDGDDPRGVEDSKLKPFTTDRFRLDVRVGSDGREIYSWAGAGRFDANGLQEIVATGAVASGSFGPFLINIFGQKGVQFTEEGSETVDGRPLRKFTYRVPREASRYDFRSSGSGRFLPYDGAFWVDPVSADIERLDIHTTAMPHVTGVCEATTSVDFHRVSISGGDYLLPRASRVEIVTQPGHFVNTSAYSGCHAYSAESAIRFEEASPAAAPPRSTQAPTGAPFARGVALALALEQDIDTRTAAAGDPVRARVVGGAVDKKSKIVVAAGAIAEGRIIRLEHQRAAPAHFLIAIEWRSLASKGSTVPFTAVVDSDESSFTVRAADLARGAATHKSASLSGGRALLFLTEDENYVVRRGYESKWVTQ